MDQEGIMLSEINQSERQMPYGFTYMWNLKKQYTWTNKTETDSWLTEGGWLERLDEKGDGIKKYKLVSCNIVTGM